MIHFSICPWVGIARLRDFVPRVRSAKAAGPKPTAGRQEMLMRINRWFLFAVVPLLSGLTGTAATATPLVTYPFNDNTDGSSGFAYTTFDSGVLSSSAVSKGSGLGEYSVGTDSWSGTTQVLKTGPGTSVANATATDAFTNDWFFQFTLTPTSSIDIRSIEADWSRGGNTAVRGWFVRSSLDTYATDLYSNQTPIGTPTGLQNVGFNITGFTGLSTPVDFRFYIYTPSTGRYMDFQNVTFNTTAVPEPSSFLPLSAGFVGVITLCRSRQGGRLGRPRVGSYT